MHASSPGGLLPRHPVLRSQDLDEACAFAARAWRPYHRVRALGRPAFSGQVQHVRGRAVAFTYLDTDSHLDVDVGDLEGFHTVHLGVEGVAEHLAGGEAVLCTPRTAVVHSPGRGIRYRRSGPGRFLVVRVDETALVRELEGLLATSLDGRALVFEPRMDVEGLGGRFAVLALELAGRLDALRPGEPLPPALLQAEKALVTALAENQRHTGSALLERREPEAGSSAVRRAEEFVIARLQHAVSAGDIARAAGVSARTLYRSFQRAHGCPLMDFVRRARLGHARLDLERASPGTTVTDVALAWGFSHMGRFAATYRAAFGETPSQTLDRARARHWRTNA